MKNEYDNYKIVQQGNQILGHLFQLKGKQQWNAFCENCRTINREFYPRLLTKTEKEKQRNPPQKGKSQKNNVSVINH